MDGGYKQITTAAKETGNNTAHEEISKENLIITEPGIVYIYLSNEDTSPVEVFGACPEGAQRLKGRLDNRA